MRRLSNAHGSERMKIYFKYFCKFCDLCKNFIDVENEAPVFECRAIPSQEAQYMEIRIYRQPKCALNAPETPKRLRFPPSLPNRTATLVYAANYLAFSGIPRIVL